MTCITIPIQQSSIMIIPSIYIYIYAKEPPFLISAHQLPMQMNTTYLHRGVEILLAEESDKHAQIRSTAQEPTPKLSDNSISATSSCMKIQKKNKFPTFLNQTQTQIVPAMPSRSSGLLLMERKLVIPIAPPFRGSFIIDLRYFWSSGSQLVSTFSMKTKFYLRPPARIRYSRLTGGRVNVMSFMLPPAFWNETQHIKLLSAPFDQKVAKWRYLGPHRNS